MPIYTNPGIAPGVIVATQRVTMASTAVPNGGFIQCSWAVVAGAAGGDTLLDLTTPNAPKFLNDGFYIATFPSSTSAAAATPGSRWSPSFTFGSLLVNEDAFAFFTAAETALFGPQVVTTLTAAGAHKGHTITCFITNGDTASHNWTADLFVSYIAGATTLLA